MPKQCPSHEICLRELYGLPKFRHSRGTASHLETGRTRTRSLRPPQAGVDLWLRRVDRESCDLGHRVSSLTDPCVREHLAISKVDDARADCGASRVPHAALGRNFWGVWNLS